MEKRDIKEPGAGESGMKPHPEQPHPGPMYRMGYKDGFNAGFDEGVRVVTQSILRFVQMDFKESGESEK
jgi:hypothetical protein